MKGIVVNEKNYKQVAGRLVKFFDHYIFDVWHDFDCGMKKRIGHKIKIMGKAVDTKRKYSVTTRTDHKGLLHAEMKYASYDPDVVECFVLEEGNEVWFLGNRVLIKREFFGFARNLYRCFQIRS